ncbi:hypothetical protein G3M48_001738 [Beauveria asiatica]|uniref:WSC domain-containing protein n=1 Tax=Beauveria asiatica TaxID=1069075 RepID=A0AAW0RZB7_9HYPO
MKSALLSYAGLANLLRMATADAEPFLSYDVHTIKDCSFWYDNYGTRTCESIRETWSISPETFSRWNPSISLDCKGWSRHSYCVGVIAELACSSSTTTSTSTSTATSTSTPPPIWTDRGCYADASYHPLQTQLPAPAGDDMTRAKCESKCWSEGYQYVGFKAGTECWCGHYIDGSHTPFQSDCSAPCAGNSSESCGGDKVYNVLEGNDPPFTPAPRTPTSTTTARPSTSTTPPASETAFLLMSHAKADCTGDVANEVLVRSDSEGTCIDTDCQVASLDIASLGSCPDGQVQISYWQQPGCSGAWYGYGYSSRHACRQLWSGGWSFKSLHLRCAKQSDDCVSKKTCTPDPEPAHGICSAQADTPAFKFKSRFHTDCTGDQHNDVTIQSDTDGACVDLDCQVGSLDIAAEGKCPNGQVQISYWEKTGCQGAWYGYGSRYKTLQTSGYWARVKARVLSYIVDQLGSDGTVTILFAGEAAADVNLFSTAQSILHEVSALQLNTTSERSNEYEFQHIQGSVDPGEMIVAEDGVFDAAKGATLLMRADFWGYCDGTDEQAMEDACDEHYERNGVD